VVSMGTNGSKGANATCSWTAWGWWWPVVSKPQCVGPTRGGAAACRLTIRLPVHPDGDGRCRLRERQAQGLELDAIAAVVLGGTSLFAGCGGGVGTFVAVMLLQVLRNLFNLLS
jgi:hypothetical protein